MPTLWLMEDQLSIELVRQLSPDRVLLIESRRHYAAGEFHKHRIAFQVSAIRHFADEVRAAGFAVHHYGLGRRPYLDSVSAIKHLVKACGDSQFVVIDPSEHHCAVWIDSLADAQAEALGIEIRIEPNTLFLTDREEFAAWAQPLKRPIMEHFYRRMRTKLGVLVEADGSPVGGEWNLDKENRKPAKRGMMFPPPLAISPDAITQGALKDVERVFPNHPGTTEGFSLPVTRADAERAWDDFVKHRLPQFGDYEDAMLTGEPILNHSFVSMLLNVALLSPMKLVRDVEAAYRAGRVPLNSAEGFIRQIIGWREYVYGIYWSFMPEYRARNSRGSKLDLPDWFWTGKTEMNCLSHCISGVVERAYSHHIQRLMVICNFATLAALSPQAVNDWFYAMYVDSHDWVVTPNVVGMGMNADGGTIATKPYISSAAYINRMSDYCQGCRFDPAERTGELACPFNYLFWTFLHHFADRFKNNPRMTMMLKNAQKIEADQMRQMMQQRKTFIELHVRGKAYRP
ncbi:cryptochrome/photolyase family protein [Humisphaera borealis]|uniref:Cryptochrome/photolyase family protein n=1 Tax=Humisphaera borealis TaxID=2807512 RepID=A0A7M2WXZ0_9BACT|nr:cryptochrome/photolyase family protein [Humisphaera borealis]QOV90345.1 cryptochrome/photolyase family protein [Humisphaera borealis]